MPPVDSVHQEYVPEPSPPEPVKTTVCPAQIGLKSAVAEGVLGRGLTVTVTWAVFAQVPKVASTVYVVVAVGDADGFEAEELLSPVFGDHEYEHPAGAVGLPPIVTDSPKQISCATPASTAKGPTVTMT